MLVRPIFVVPIQMSIRSPGVHGPDEIALGARENQAGKPIVREVAGQLAPVRPSRLFHVGEVHGVVDVAEQIAIAKSRLKLMAKSECGHVRDVVSGFSRTVE